jgi:plastocyanin
MRGLPMSSKAGAPATLAAGALALATGAPALLPAGASGGARSASAHTVVLKEIRFRPATLNIRRGDSVRWIWRDGRNEHNVAFRGFRSRTQTSGSYTVRFTHSGTFNYVCTLHVAEGMRGRILVR